MSSEAWEAVIGSFCFGFVGLLLLLLGFKMFDWITPKLDIEQELAEKQNVAVAIVVSAIILGVCFIVASVVN